jgi:hypothetical protein
MSNNFYYQFGVDKITLIIRNQRNHFLNQFQSKQTITDQENLSYSFNTNTIVYVDSKLNKINVESKQNKQNRFLIQN